MTEAMRRLAEQAHPGFPVSIYYAFKQSETKGETGTASTGWETFLDARDPRWFSHHRHIADTYRGRWEDPCKRFQRPRLQHRPSSAASAL